MGGRGWSEARVKPRNVIRNVSLESEHCWLLHRGFLRRLSPTPATQNSDGPRNSQPLRRDEQRSEQPQARDYGRPE